MRVSEIVRRSRGFSYSFEVFPGMGRNGRNIYRVIDEMVKLGPRFISVTYGAGGGNRRDLLSLCGHIAARGVTPLPHFTAVGHTRREVDEVLSSFRDHRFENVLALRGDPPRNHEGPVEDLFRDFSNASQLIRHVKEHHPPCVGAAAYPEGRPDCSREDNLGYAREKRDAGAEFFITQMFFENDCFYRFVEESGLGEAVIPGILPIFGPGQLEMAKNLAGAHIPRPLLQRLMRCRDDAEAFREVGLDHASAQISELVGAGFGFVHIFTLNRWRDTAELLERVRLRDRRRASGPR